jgi:hypothetical protein
MRRIAFIVAGFLIGLSLVACSESPDAQDVPECKSGGLSNGTGCAVTIDYKGKPLNCVSWQGSHGETGLTCDFVEYHAMR